jgi:hypothetical protein
MMREWKAPTQLGPLERANLSQHLEMSENRTSKLLHPQKQKRWNKTGASSKEWGMSISIALTGAPFVVFMIIAVNVQSEKATESEMGGVE